MSPCLAPAHSENTLIGFKDVYLKAKAGSWPRLSYMCRVKAQGPSRTCNESKEEEEGSLEGRAWIAVNIDVTLSCA